MVVCASIDNAKNGRDVMGRERYYNHQRVCQQCGDTFHAARYDAMYCSARCRQRARRASVMRDKKLSLIKDTMFQLLDECDDPRQYEIMLDEIQSAIDAARIQTI